MMMVPQKVHWSVRRRADAASVMSALWVSVVVGVLAFVLDGGMIFLQRRQVQAAAEASSLAAASAVFKEAQPAYLRPSHFT
jgi:uncharacterized membrane protein